MDFALDQLWANMGLMAKAVTVVLLLMAVAGLGVFLERIFVFARSHLRSRRFAQAAEGPLEAGRWEEVLQLCGSQGGSFLAELVAAGLSSFLGQAGRSKRAAERGGGTAAPVEAGVEEAGLGPLERLQRVLQRKGEAQAAELRRGFPVLASVGSVAPFVGLLGTVVGIINAFEGIARTGSGGLGSVSAGIAEALVVTALGLAVAIPAVLAFNFLTTRAERLELALAHAAEELLEHLALQGGAPRASRPTASAPAPVQVPGECAPPAWAEVAAGGGDAV